MYTIRFHYAFTVSETAAAIKSPTASVPTGFCLFKSSVATFSSIALETAARIAFASYTRFNEVSKSIAADNIVAIGFAIFLPAPCGNEP